MAEVVCLGELLIDFVPAGAGDDPARSRHVSQGGGWRPRECRSRAGARRHHQCLYGTSGR
jgi:hypothetical protein